MSAKSALIIEAGVGGIAAAARLAQQGYDVTVLEKNDRPDGRAFLIQQDGFTFDTGPSLFLMPDTYAETYAALGERMEEHLDLARVDPTYRIHFHRHQPDRDRRRVGGALPLRRAGGADRRCRRSRRRRDAGKRRAVEGRCGHRQHGHWRAPTPTASR